jgi:hypothetical protein
MKLFTKVLPVESRFFTSSQSFKSVDAGSASCNLSAILKLHNFGVCPNSTFDSYFQFVGF